MKMMRLGKHGAYPRRETSNLRKGRVSIAQARYFITINAERPCFGLTGESVASRLMYVLSEMQDSGDFTLMASTIMPDHVHLLIQLHDRLTISQVCGKFKAKSRDTLLRCGAKWQRNFYEHRLRPDDDVSPFAIYILLNPYRKKLIPAHESWPWWQRGNFAAFDFDDLLLDGDCPPSAWVAWELADLGLTTSQVGPD